MSEVLIHSMLLDIEFQFCLGMKTLLVTPIKTNIKVEFGTKLRGDYAEH